MNTVENAINDTIECVMRYCEERVSERTEIDGGKRVKNKIETEMSTSESPILGVVSKLYSENKFISSI